MNQASVSKLTATQNIIRNKFEKAHKIRLENEHDVNRAMKPHTASITSGLESKNNDPRIVSKTTTNHSPQLHLATESCSNHVIKTNDDPNTLCDILRTLLASSQNVDKIECMRQINAILDELRDLEIII